MKTVISVIFIIQFSIQLLLENEIFQYRNTNAMHEDLVTTIIGCTLIIVFALKESK